MKKYSAEENWLCKWSRVRFLKTSSSCWHNGQDRREVSADMIRGVKENPSRRNV